jgi:hypothetical protein
MPNTREYGGGTVTVLVSEKASDSFGTEIQTRIWCVTAKKNALL